jgi:hypothetical protein
LTAKVTVCCASWLTPPRRETAEKEPEPWRLAAYTRDDQKLLIVTFAATLAANLVTVLAVGVGIVIWRVSATRATGEAFTIATMLLTAVVVTTMFAGTLIRRRGKSPAAFVNKVYFGLNMLGITCWALLVLAVVGLASRLSG